MTTVGVTQPGSCEVCGACSALPDYAADGTRRGCLCVACGLLTRSLAHTDQRDRVRRAIDYVVWHAGRGRPAEPLDSAADRP